MLAAGRAMRGQRGGTGRGSRKSTDAAGILGPPTSSRSFRPELGDEGDLPDETPDQPPDPSGFVLPDFAIQLLPASKISTHLPRRPICRRCRSRMKNSLHKCAARFRVSFGDDADVCYRCSGELSEDEFFGSLRRGTIGIWRQRVDASTRRTRPVSEGSSAFESCLLMRTVRLGPNPTMVCLTSATTASSFATHVRRHLVEDDERMDRRTKAAKPAKPTKSDEVFRGVDSKSGSLSFAGTSYRVGNRYRGQNAGVRLVGDTVQITIDGQLVGTHRARHDKVQGVRSPRSTQRKAQEVLRCGIATEADPRRGS